MMTLHGKKAPVSAVCEQCEWDALQLARPGYHTLVRAGIASEGEDIRVVPTPADEALRWVAEGKINNALTIIALQWLALNRDSLRKNDALHGSSARKVAKTPRLISAAMMP